MVSILKRNDILANITPQNLKTLLLQSPSRNFPKSGLVTNGIRAYRFPTYEITLMAHGECEDDISKQFGGWIDSKLSPFGVEQAKRAGKIMAMDDTHYHVAYTSEMERAQETAKHVLEPLAMQPKVFATWRLNDRHLGDLSGYNRSQMALVHGERKVKEWTEEYTSMPPIIKVENPKYRTIMENMHKKHMTTDQIPRAESLQMVYNRVLPYWENIIVPSLKMRNRCIVVAHNTSLCALIRRFAELSDNEAMHVSLPPAIPFTFTLDNHMKIIRGKAVKQSAKPRAQVLQTAQAPPTPVTSSSGSTGGANMAEQHFAMQQQSRSRVNDDIKSRH